MKKIGALAIALVVVAAMAVTAFAASTPSITIYTPANSGAALTDTTEYTWYRIFEADIEEDPSGSPEQSGGKVAYYVDTAAKATEIVGTDLFNVVRVGETDKWYVELKDESTTAQDIVAAFGAMDLTKFPSGDFNQSTPGGKAESGEVAPGYYYITSTLGSEIVLQTLTEVEIYEKNTYITDDKTIDEADKNAEIGKDVTYTLTVNVPASANDVIVLTDTLSKGLTFKEFSGTIPFDGVASTPAAAGSGSTAFTITWSADKVKAMTSGSTAQTLTIYVIATVNEEAAIDTGIPNTLDLTYGNNYQAVPSIVETKTTNFDFDKVDGASGSIKLTGAEFMLTRDGTSGTAIPLVEVDPGKTYRIATANDSTTTKVILTNGNTVTVNGLDADETYKLLETKAPTGYNKLDAPLTVEKSGTVFAHMDVENNKGTVLPSTGGMGTTILYIAGAILVLGAGILLVTKRRMGN